MQPETRLSASRGLELDNLRSTLSIDPMLVPTPGDRHPSYGIQTLQTIKAASLPARRRTLLPRALSHLFFATLLLAA